MVRASTYFYKPSDKAWDIRNGTGISDTKIGKVKQGSSNKDEKLAPKRLGNVEQSALSGSKTKIDKNKRQLL